MDKSGTVTLDELREGLEKQGSAITQKEVEQLMESIDVDATGSIDYDEFLAATINMSQPQVGTLHYPFRRKPFSALIAFDREQCCLGQPPH